MLSNAISDPLSGSITLDYVEPDTIQVRELALGLPGRISLLVDIAQGTDDGADIAVTVAGVEPDQIAELMQDVSKILGSLGVKVVREGEEAPTGAS